MDAAVEDVVELAQARDRAVEDGDVGAEADRHLGRVQADDAAADDRDLARQHAGHAAEQHAAAAIGLLQRGRAGLDRQAAGDFRHRREQRQAAAVVGHGLVGDGGDAGGEQALGLLRIGREMQVGVEDLVVAQLHPFAGLRLLDLDDHVGAGEDVFGGLDDLRAGGAVGVVVGADAGAGARLDEHLMAMRDVFADGARRQADAVFVVLDFLRAADAHVCLLTMQDEIPEDNQTTERAACACEVGCRTRPIPAILAASARQFEGCANHGLGQDRYRHSGRSAE